MPDADEFQRNWSLICECGNGKGKTAAACKDCSHLDGQFDYDRRIIRAMRDHRMLTVTALAHHAEFRWTESLTRTMQRFVRSGRVRTVSDISVEGGNTLTYIWVGDY